MDTNGKVVEVILKGNDNGFFDFATEKIKQIWPHLNNILPQKNKQRSIVVKGDEFWICQYFNAPNFTGDYEINLYVKLLSNMSDMHIVTQDGEIPDTDVYKVGIPSLWVALSDFLCIPTSTYQRNELANMVEKNSDGCFVYEEQRHDIRSYRLGRSATIQEIALILSSDTFYA